MGLISTQIALLLIVAEGHITVAKRFNARMRTSSFVRGGATIEMVPLVRRRSATQMDRIQFANRGINAPATIAWSLRDQNRPGRDGKGR